MPETVFLSGATGLPGTETAKQLLLYPDCRVYVLVRGENEAHTLSRLKGAWNHEPSLSKAIGKQFFVIHGDFVKKGLDLKKEDAEKLSEEVTYIIHTGAETGFSKSAETMFETNVRSTKNMAEFAEQCGLLKRFVHVSTAYVCGNQEAMGNPPILTIMALAKKICSLLR